MPDPIRLVSDNLRPLPEGLPPWARFLLQCLLDHPELSAAELREWLRIVLEVDR